MPDPANPQSLNRYTYVTNNPARYIDPSGHSQVECTGTANECSGEPQGDRSSVGRGSPGYCRLRGDEDLEFCLKSDEYWDVIYKWMGSGWNQISSFDIVFLRMMGWNSQKWKMSDFDGGGSAVDISGTSEDPAVWLSLILSGAIVFCRNGTFLCLRRAGTTGTVVCADGDCANEVESGIRYSERVINQTDLYHDFPTIYDNFIIKTGELTKINGPYIQYELEGWVNDSRGMFQIGMELLTITHRFFLPFK
ncbi:MAG: hypothetical protein OEZ02_12505 [Anaerolineae bacterium]|nr:hypothetical protein [Anaerolineae bacterium]